MKKTELFENYKTFINSICKEKCLNQFALEYFATLQSLEIQLTKKDLEFIFVANKNYKIVLQDLQINLFKNTDSISIAEVFYYMATHYLKGIKSEVLNGKSLGLLENYVAKIDLKQIKNETKSYFKYFSETLEKADFKKFFATIAKNTVFHELSHILQIKKFEDMYNFGYSAIFVDENNYIKASLIDNNSCKPVINQGRFIFTEAINDTFSLLLANNLNIIDFKNMPKEYIFYAKTKKFYSEKVDDFNIVLVRQYLHSAKCLPFFNSLINEDFTYLDENLKNSKFLNNLFNTKIDSELLTRVKKFVYFAMFDLAEKNKKFHDINKDIIKLEQDINKLKNHDMFFVLVGLNDFQYKDINLFPAYVEKYMQAFLINCYKNRIEDIFNAKNKDAKFFAKINQNLLDMNKFMFLPNWKKKYDCRNLQTGNIEVKFLHDVDCIEEIADNFPKLINFVEFYKLILKIKSEVKKLSPTEQKLANQKLTFLSEQGKKSQLFSIIKSHKEKEKVN